MKPDGKWKSSKHNKIKNWVPAHHHLCQWHICEQNLVAMATLDISDSPPSLSQVSQHEAEVLLLHSHLQGHHGLQDLAPCQPQSLRPTHHYNPTVYSNRKSNIYLCHAAGRASGHHSRRCSCFRPDIPDQCRHAHQRVTKHGSWQRRHMM